MGRPSSVVQDGEGRGRSLRATAVLEAVAAGRREEGDNDRGPQFCDCARMVHKTANVLDKLPRGVQPRAKRMLHEISLAEGRAEAEKASDLFVATYEAKYPKATECLSKDRDVLLRFYD